MSDISEKEALLEFLKKYSDIDIEFIKEFIEIQEADHVHEPFSIDLEIVAKWLNSSKKELSKTIKNSYIENIDYLVLKGGITPTKR